MSRRMDDALVSGLRLACAMVFCLCLAALAGCTQEPKPGAESKSALKRVEPGKEFSGFLQDYSKLKPNEKMGGDALTFVNPDKMKSLHRYVAIIVDPVQVYVSTAADPSLIPRQWPGGGCQILRACFGRGGFRRLSGGRISRPAGFAASCGHRRD